MDSHSEDYEELVSSGLSVKLQIKKGAARKIVKLRSLIFNEDVWLFLKGNSRLGVFSDFHFIKPYGTIKNDGGTLSLDILDAFVNGKHPAKHDEDWKQQGRARKLDVIALSCDHEARDFLVSMFLKSVAAISTLCSFVSEGRDMTWSQIMDIVARYTNESWESDSKQREYHNEVNQIHLVDGWHLVSEVYKIQVQELYFLKESSDNHAEALQLIKLEDVKSKVPEFTKNVVCEFLAWCVLFLKDAQKKDFQTDSLLDMVDELQDKLVNTIGVTSNEEATVDEEYLRNLLQAVAVNHPTMAEVKYECKDMTPCRREARLNVSKREIVWKTDEIFKRCRWDGSSASQVYQKFLEKSVLEDEKLLLSERHEPELPPSNSTSEKVLTTSPGTSNLSGMLDEGNRKRTAPQIEYEGLQVKPREAEARKRLKESLDQNSERLRLTLQQQRVKRGEQLRNRYCDDGESSDEERADGSEAAVNIEDRQAELMQEVNLVVQLLYELILDWPVFPIDPAQYDFARLSSPNAFITPESKAGRSAASDVLTGDQRFVRIHAKLRRTNLFRDVTDARRIARYGEHWRHTLPFEIRGMVSDALSELLPTVKADPRKHNEWTRDIDNHKYLNFSVRKVHGEKGLFNITCQSTNPVLNKRIVTELQGGTLCVGYVHGLRDDYGHSRLQDEDVWKSMCKKTPQVEKFSTLVLIACRRVTWDHDDEYDTVDDRAINEITVHLALSKHRLKHINGIWEDDTIRLLYLCPLTPHLRMFKSVQEATLLPGDVARILCGPVAPNFPSHDELVSRVDKGCYEYLQNVRRTTTLIDETQMKALLSVLGNIGDAIPGSSSVSLVQGPPGTGKTTLLILLIGALLHHSTKGHVNREQIHMLRSELGSDGILRRANNHEALGILVCAGSNQAVDNIIQRMDEHGIPDGDGGGLHPQAVRLARQGYDYGAIRKYCMNDKALPFDINIYNRNEPNRAKASSAARKSFCKEVIVCFTTCSTSGGARLKNMNGNWDVTIIDEAGQVNEPESMIPIVNAYKRNLNRRSHTVLCGDQVQLEPMVAAMWIMKKNQQFLPFDYSMQMKSLFERLQRKKRCPFNMLMIQYRSHPCIAKLVSSTFYNGVVKSVIPPSVFADTYNSGCSADGTGFAPVTIVDTSRLASRFEHNDKKGNVENILEIEIVGEILDEIRRLTAENFHKLKNQIAILAPYRAQVALARKFLEANHYYKDGKGPTRRGFEMLVDTVDSMQGAQREVVIISATRSNIDKSVGFVDRPNRLNVAISRARKLLVIVADLSTMSVNREFQEFWNYAAHGYNGAALLMRNEGKRGNETGTTMRVLKTAEERTKYLLHARKIGQV